MKKSILAHEVLKAIGRDVKDKEEQRQTVNKGGATQQIYNLCSCLIGEHLSSPSEGSLANMKDNRTAFSVTLNNERSLTCFGPFSDDRGVPFKHVFLNLGNSYNVQTGIFTVPYSGVYNLAATVYSRSLVDLPQATCALLQFNGVTVAPLIEKNGLDSEDSNTVVVVKHLKAGDQVSVNLQKGCNICDDTTHYNTFTGFMLYAAEKE
ncbi:hypothetical protein XENOCAPTIV_014209 [Xenoophorus captivus]|uniref:C1q domain-containing protein n=1 Tax=Xenoophorus captivus TaxID=1517983 RepID=A0ABV0RHB1_9TELE